MPVVHVYTAEGWLSPARKKLMIEKVTAAVVEAEGLPEVREMTYVLVQEVPDGGWGYRGKAWVKEEFEGRKPPEPNGHDARASK
jgi:phenylpyruvate tautomerase PptA (4-oxalocrotonate tautomerase family)